MEKYIYYNNGLWCELDGDYYLPSIVISEEEIYTIGICVIKHQQYLEEYRTIPLLRSGSQWQVDQLSC